MKRFTDKQMLIMAIEYITNFRSSMRTLGKKYGVSCSTMHRYLHRACKLSKGIWKYVGIKISYQKALFRSYYKNYEFLKMVYATKVLKPRLLKRLMSIDRALKNA